MVLYFKNGSQIEIFLTGTFNQNVALYHIGPYRSLINTKLFKNYAINPPPPLDRRF